MNDILRPTGVPILRTLDLRKSYFRVEEVQVLRGVNLDVHEGEMISIIGSSGSGKSTLLHLLGTLDEPTSGEIYFAGERINNRPPAFRDRFRNQVIGFIFQFYHLLPELTALENVLLPAMVRHGLFSYLGSRQRLRQRAQYLLERVGLTHRRRHRPNEMSGGEMQRCAIARALLVEPKILLADEPTGNLDTDTGESIIDLLHEIRAETQLTVVMVTHNPALAERSDRQFRMHHGQLVETPLSVQKPTLTLSAG